MQPIAPTEFMWIVTRDAEICGAAPDEESALELLRDQFADDDEHHMYSIAEYACMGGVH